MATDTLDFEEPVAVLLKEIEALALMPGSPAHAAAIAELEARVAAVRSEIFAHLTPWQCVLVARHSNRPCTLDYVERLFTDFTELHGDRRFADDAAIIAGMGQFHGEPVMIVGHQKGRDTKQKIFRNFGYAKPEGYRKALRVMQMAEKFHRPILVFVDTPAAYPGIESEERGVAEAIAVNLREMAMLDVPIVVLVCGEGGSGGALGIAIGDRVLMQEFAIYSVIPPEGCASILWRDSARKVEAAEALKITAPDLLAFGLVDEIVKEPIGGAHNDYGLAMALADEAIGRHLRELQALPPAELVDRRYEKFRAMGRIGHAFVEDTEPVAGPARRRASAAAPDLAGDGSVKPAAPPRVPSPARAPKRPRAAKAGKAS